ncbi:MAG TPA: hypothetical protein VEB68_05305 [Croceibacterium sp.]|nr:hypothetical protein [Croceibacterium sp.]
MNSVVAFLSPLALLLPAVAGELPGAAPPDDMARAAPEDAAPPPMGFDPASTEPFSLLGEARQPPRADQVRIEERVIIRIAPSSPAVRERMMALLPRRSQPTSYQEQKLDGCVPIGAIVGVQPARQNRLLLFMRDRRILSAALERACNADDFYSGFYIEQSRDGQLCSRRDELQSRTGASCKVAQLNRLVALRD